MISVFPSDSGKRMLTTGEAPVATSADEAAPVGADSGTHHRCGDPPGLLLPSAALRTGCSPHGQPWYG